MNLVLLVPGSFIQNLFLTGDVFVDERFLVAPELLDEPFLLTDDAVDLGTLGVEVSSDFLLFSVASRDSYLEISKSLVIYYG